MTGKHSHYKKDVSHLKMIDVYRIIDLYEITDGCFQHALKKILVPGQRGHKDLKKDIEDIIDSMQRKLEMMEEDSKQKVKKKVRKLLQELEEEGEDNHTSETDDSFEGQVTVPQETERTLNDTPPEEEGEDVSASGIVDDNLWRGPYIPPKQKHQTRLSDVTPEEWDSLFREIAKRKHIAKRSPLGYPYGVETCGATCGIS